MTHRIRTEAKKYADKPGNGPLERRCKRAGFKAGAKWALSEAAMLAEHPYGDDVQVIGPEEPSAVGRKIARAIRQLADEPTESA